MSVIIPSGSYYCYQDRCGIYFWGVHGHDAIWHLAIIETAFRRIPFISPVFSGANLSGYNYLFDLLISVFSKISGISPLLIFFKIIPIVWFILFTLLSISLARKLKDNKIFVGFFLFFLYFSSSFTYIITLIKDQTIFGSAGLLSQQIYHLMFNLQYAISILTILYLIIKIKENKINTKTIITFAVITFINMGLKFYGGFVTLTLGGLYILLNYISLGIKKTTTYLAIIGFGFGLSVLVFYSPLNSKTGSIFSLSPFALVHPITEDPGLFYLRKLTDARYFLLTQGIGPKLILIELVNLLLFLFFYMGVRFFGLIYLIVKIIRRKINQFDLVLLGTMAVSISTSILLVQKAEWWNTIQFFYYAIFLSTVYTAELAFILIKNKVIISKVILMVLIIMSIPTTIDIVKNSISLFPGGTYISDGEVEALTYLKTQPRGTVLSPYFDPRLTNRYQIPRPIFANGDTAYVSALSGQPSYFTDLVQIRLTGIDYQKRLENVKNNDCRILKEVDYVYFNNDFKIARSLFDCPAKLEFLWGNRTATIYKVIK